MSVYASSSNGYNFHRENCGNDGEACPTAEHGALRNPADHDHVLALEEQQLREERLRCESTRIDRAIAIADMAQMAAAEIGKKSPTGKTLAELVRRVDEYAAHGVNESPSDTSKKRSLTVPQMDALKYFGRLATDGFADYDIRPRAPKVGTIVALISRGLITAARSGRMEDHKVTDAGWVHLHR